MTLKEKFADFLIKTGTNEAPEEIRELLRGAFYLGAVAAGHSVTEALLTRNLDAVDRAIKRVGIECKEHLAVMASRRVR